MDFAQPNFDKRLRKIDRKHRKMARGYTTYLDRESGLIVARPKRVRIRVPITGLIYLACGFVFFKGLLLAHLGSGTYVDRVGILNQGTIVEQAGGWMMQIDPASEWVAAQLRPFLQ